MSPTTFILSVILIVLYLGLSAIKDLFMMLITMQQADENTKRALKAWVNDDEDDFDEDMKDVPELVDAKNWQ